MNLKDGTYVPGVTSITKQIDKPFLVKWANKLGFNDINVEEYVAESAVKGTKIHNAIESFLSQTPIDISEYTQEDMTMAELALDRFKTWSTKHNLTNINVELELVSETYKYGGILDLYCQVDGKWTIIDLKTSKQVNKEQIMQVCAYYYLALDNKLPVEKLMVISVGKENDSRLCVEEIDITQVNIYFLIFLNLLNIYNLRYRLGWS